MYITYITKNLITGEFYIGSHKVSENDDNYIGSGKLLRENVEKYGLENFVRETVGAFESREESLQLEHKLIKEKKSNALCLNLSYGGNSFDYINQNLKFDRASFGSLASHEAATERKFKNIENYMKSPNRCKCCNKIFEYELRNNLFCSSSCAATFNNKHRKRQQADSEKRFCLMCGKELPSSSRKNGKFCDNHCSALYFAECREMSDKRKKLLSNKSRIKQMHDSGLSYRKIAVEFDVSGNMIKDLLKNRL